MRAWLYRWPNGDSSVVWAATRLDAAWILDEVGMAAPSALIPLRSGAVHFHLEDDGELLCEGFSESIEEALAEKAYPLIEEAKGKAFDETGGEPLSEEMMAVVQAERNRVADYPDDAKTQKGRMLQSAMDLSGAVADRFVLENHDGPKQ
jgi:hypothetical protein